MREQNTINKTAKTGNSLLDLPGSEREERTWEREKASEERELDLNRLEDNKEDIPCMGQSILNNKINQGTTLPGDDKDIAWDTYI